VSLTTTSLDNLTLNILEEIQVGAPLEATFAALLEQMGPGNQSPDGKPMPMTIEAWPGGRWFRDLGNGSGHFWGHVQAIKSPTLLEITGPLFMSSPVVSNVQYRLKETNGGTLITLKHSAFGFVPEGYRDGTSKGWTNILDRTRRQAEAARNTH
jgi:Activator of Hsp90 ATPase homolog 1-like protein